MKQANSERVLEAVTVYDQAAYQALVHLMMTKLRRWPRYFLMLTGALTIVGSGYTMIVQGLISPWMLLLLLLGNLLFVVALFADRFALRLMMASNRKGTTVTNHYRFHENDWGIQNSAVQQQYTYAFINRVLETENYLFFFMRDGQVYLLRRTDMTLGTYPQLRALLDEKLASAKEQAA
ncbi:MAG: YcxB family protein [Clostridia bacterium]